MSLDSVTARLAPYAYALLRFISGTLFALHGVQKLLGWPGDRPSLAFGSQLWLGGLIELVAGGLIALGLFTRPAAFLASGTMAVAYIQFHWKLALGGLMWLPGVNKGEPAVLYCCVFLYMAAQGAGPLSFDRRR